MIEVLIKNVRIVDGTGNPWYWGHVGIKDGKISGIWRGQSGRIEADETIDGSGCCLMPGVVDVHGHSDFTVKDNPGLSNLLRQGITTQAVGQCGSSMYAFGDAYVSRVRERTNTEDDIGWRTLKEWRDMVQKQGLGVNLAPLVGHNTLRYSAMKEQGDVRVDPTDEEMQIMKELLHKGMQQGAFGLTTGLRYPHGRTSHTDEVIDLCRMVKPYGGVHISHMRSEEEYMLPSVAELIDTAEQSGVPSCATHHKAVFFPNWGAPAESLRLLEEARDRGVEVFCDIYPWMYAREVNLGSWFQGHMLGDDSDAGKSADDLLAVLSDDDEWKVMKQQLIEQHQKLKLENEKRQEKLFSRGVYVPDLWDPAFFDCVVYSPSHPEVVDMNFSQVANELDLTDHWEAMRQVYLADKGKTLVAAGPISEADVRRILQHPLSMVSTDSVGLEDDPDLQDPQSGAHPRGWGTYPRVLGHYVRDEAVLDLEDAVRKMTALPAHFLGLQDRGQIQVGFHADLVLFDPETVASGADFADPCQPPLGIRAVFVNGEKVVSEGEVSDNLAGKVLRRN